MVVMHYGIKTLCKRTTPILNNEPLSVTFAVVILVAPYFIVTTLINFVSLLVSNRMLIKDV